MAVSKKQGPPPRDNSGGGGWFQAGYDAVSQEVKRQETRQKTYADQVRRYWMPVGAGTDPNKKSMIVFVDGVPFNYREHNFFANNSWRNWATCLVGTNQTCPYDQAGNKSYFVGAYTVIDCNQWEARDGTTHKNELSLYATKADALKMIKIHADRRGGDLAGCAFYVARTGDKSPSTGSMLDFVEKFAVKKVKIPFGNQMVERVILDTTDAKVIKRFGFRKPILPINYIQKLQPKSRADAENYLAELNVSTGDSKDTSGEVAY